MKPDGEIMEILDAYDLIGSLRATAELTAARTTPLPNTFRPGTRGRHIGRPAAWGRVTDAFLPKIEERIEASKGRSGPIRRTRISSPWATRVRKSPRA